MSKFSGQVATEMVTCFIPEHVLQHSRVITTVAPFNNIRISSIVNVQSIFPNYREAVSFDFAISSFQIEDRRGVFPTADLLEITQGMADSPYM